jgi:DNA recombination protein RmuC
MTIATLIAALVGILIGFLFANTPYGARLSLGNSRDDAKNIANQVLDETALKTQSMLNETVVRINQEVQRIEAKVATLETSQTAHMAGLQENIRQVLSVSEKLNDQTTKLDGALRNNKQMGRWGELQLRRLVELSGMLEHVDFDEQSASSTTNRPDMTVRFANDSTLYVDSKVSLNAYVEGVSTADGTARQEFAKEQFRALKAHVDELHRRRYHGESTSLPFTVMYIQVEGSLAFADEGRTGADSLVDYALSRDIIIATPGTMMALLRTAYLSWRQRNDVAKALDLLEHVKVLLDRMKTFMGHYERTSKDLKDFVDTFNKMAGSWNRQVYPQMERINNTRMDTIEIYEATPIDHDVPSVREIADTGPSAG